MGQFDNTALDDYAQQRQQSAAPAGLRQTAGRSSDQFQQTQLDQVAFDEGYQYEPQSWYTGANAEGTNNGWDSQFVEDFISGQEEAAQQGTLGTYFEQPKATGVVTWDHQSTDGRHEFTFGDVYQNGKFQGNLFDQFDKNTANLMMADWLFDGKTKAEIYSSSDNLARLNREVQAKREENNTEIPKALSAQEFNADVEQRAQDFESGHVDEAIEGGGAAGGAAIGAGLGTLVAPGIGTAIGGGIGAIVGGTAAYLNKDALTEQAARAYEITAMSTEENGTAAGYATGLQQWAGFGGRLISPLSNLTQGVADASLGKVGDGQSEFYRVDKAGDSTVPKWMKVADVAASVGDSALQFATPVGAALYTTQMSGVIGGEVGELALTGGKSFDYTRGDFDSVFTDDQGNFSPTMALAGIGKVGIDAVQLGMARGLMGKADAALVAGGESAAYRSAGTGLLGRIFGSRYNAEASGFKFALGSSGEVEGRRLALSILAPSEQLSALSARVMALRTAAKTGRAVTADDFYTAATRLATGESRWRTALVNGMGEGYEEAVQAVLDPYSHDSRVSLADIGSAAAYGFAGGAGMGLGIGSRMPSMDDKMFAQAQVAQLFQTGGVTLTRREWDAMPEVQKRGMAAMADVEHATAEAAYRKIADDQAADLTAGFVGVNKLADAVQSRLQQSLARATDRTDGAFVIQQLEDAGSVDATGALRPGSMPSDAVGASGLQTAVNHANRMRGVAVQLGSLQRDLAAAAAQAEKDPGNGDLQAKVAELEKRVAQTQLMLRWGQLIDQELDLRVGRMYAETADPATVQAEADSLNELLRRMFNRQVDFADGVQLTDDDRMALARAVAQVVTRDPQDQSGSYQVLVPQVSANLTLSRADNVLQVSHAILPAIRGDYDGDKVRQQSQLMLDDEEFASARAGMHFLGAGTSVNVGAPKYEKWVVESMGRALEGPNPTLAAYATGTMTDIATAIRGRYAGAIDDSVLDSVLSAFFDAVRAGSKDARATLLDGLAERAGSQITEFARGHLSNEWLWIDQLVRAKTQEFQEGYAAHRPEIGPAPDTTTAVPKQQTTVLRERRAARAATLGQTVGMQFAGDTMFRKSQKMHYTSLVAPVLSAEQAGTQEQLYALAQLYEALGQGMTRSELDEVRGKDDVTSRVYARLLRVAREAQELDPGLNPVEALAVVANLRVADIKVAEDGTVSPTGKEITLAQLLLRRSVEQDREDKDLIFAASPELRAKHAKLLAMTYPPTQGVKGSRPVNAERAFVEVVGSQQLFTLLGEDAAVFGPHLTVEQYVRLYASMSEADRRAEDRKLKGEAAYLGRVKRHNIPFDLDEAVRGEISAYRAIVDAVTAVGHNRITIDSDGSLHGEFAQRSNDTGKSFRDAHVQARQALQEFAGLSRRADGELSVETVQRLLDANPDFARRVMGLIPNAAANAVFELRDGEVMIANWVYKTLAIKDPAEAEMHYWRNLLLAEWNALGAQAAVSEEESDEGQRGRQYSRLPRRMHRIIYDLHPARAKDGGLRLSKLIRQMETATSLDEFVKWVNTEPGIRGDQAPITAWVDDVAEFDPDKASGGWTQALTGAELREAISSLQRASQNLVRDLADERAALNADVQVLQAVRRVIRSDSGDASVQLDAGDRALHQQLQQAIDEAGELMTGLGPQAMVYQTVLAALGFFPQAHTKGVTPEHVQAAGEFDATRDALDYTTNVERVMAALTSQNLDALGSAMGQLAKDDVRAMDDEGRQIEWQKPTVESMVSMLENPDTRPMARAILFPQVMERDFDGALRPKLLVGKSLRSLLNGTSHKELFPKGDRLSLDSALRYLSAVEANARKHGGRFSVQRAVNDLVIARTSSADHVLTASEVEQMTLKAYHEVAQILQAAGSRAADAENRPGVDPLAELMKTAKAANRRALAGRALGFTGEELELTDAVLDQLVAERKAEAERDKRELLKSGRPDLADAVDAEVARFEERLALLRSDDLAGAVVQMFSYPADPALQPAARQKLVEYVAGNLKILERSTSSILTLNKLTNQLLDHGRAGQVDLTDAEWAELSNAVIAVYLDDVASTTAAGVSVPPFPDAEHADDQRYYDASFGYLLDPLLTADSPIVQAAKDLHLRAGRHGVVATDQEIADLLGRTIFAEHSLGQWTSDIPRASIEPNQRFDSASAAPAISMAGNLPKRQAAISAATRRTFAVPGDELLSTATLSWLDLNKPIYDEVEVAHPTGAVSRPLAQLSNRFAKSVTLTYTGADGAVQQLDLLAADRNLGRVFHTDDVAAASGFQAIHLDRVRRAVDVEMAKLGLSPATASVEVVFAHPDMQPAAPEWFNNLFFEGVNFRLDADRFESLNAGLYFAEGGVNPTAQATALDASKLGKPALQVIEVPSAEDRRVLEDGWMTDLAAVLRAKTRQILETDMGFGRLDPEYYNAVYKNLKLRHFVRGEVDGEPQLLTAEQVIEAQRAGADLGVESPTLWVPSDDVLRTMLGEQGTQGVGFSPDLEIDLARVPTYRGVTDEMRQRFAAGVRGDVAELADTRVASRARQQLLEVRAMLDDATRNGYDARMRFLREQQDAAWVDRSDIQRLPDGGFSPNDNLAAAMRAGDQMLRAENIAFDWSRVAPFIGPRSPADTALSAMLLHELTAALQADGYRTGWIFREGAPSNPPAGQLSEVSLSTNTRAGLRVAPGDLVVFELEPFRGDTKKARSRLDYMVDHGAIVVLGSTDGQADMRAELADYLESRGYERIAGSKHVYQPADTTERYQNQKARASTLLETRGVSTRSMVSILNVPDKAVEENAAWVNGDNERLRSIAVQLNLVPTDFLGGFNVPVTPAQVDAVRAHLRGLDNDNGRGLLREQAGDEDGSLDQAFTRLLQRFGDNPGGVLPAAGEEFGTGDLIPLIDMQGRVLLYRHGFKAPRRDQVDRMTAQTLKGSSDAANVAVFPSKREPAATTHTGTVVRFTPRSISGLSVELNIPLQVFGDKKVLEWNGMKYLLTPRPESIALPDHGFFRDWGLDLIASAHDMASKESFEGLVNNHRNAFAYFGIDFLGDVAKFFDVEPSQARELLHAIATRAPRIQVSAADEILNAERLPQSFLKQLPEFAAQVSDLASPQWTARLEDGSVEARITAAIVVYLHTPGAKVEHVLQSGGFNDEAATPDSMSRLMPRLFTQVFDNAPLGSALRTEVNRRLNEQIHNPRNDGTGYRLHQDWTFESRTGDPGKTLRGFLQFAEAHSSGDNPVKNGMAFDEDERGNVSQHAAAIAYQATGAETGYAHDLSRARLFASGEGITRFERDSLDGGAWRMLTGIDLEDRSAGLAYRAQTHAEAARRGLARDAVVQFRQEIDTADGNGWNDKTRKEYGDLARQITRELGLQDTQIGVVDFWVRQVLGMPSGLDEDGNELGRVTGKGAVEAAKDILWNVQHRYMPTLGAEVPLLHVHDLQLIFRANDGKANGWAPRESMDPKSAKVTGWDEWVKTSLGSALTADNLFDPLYLIALDGFMHSYQNATRSLTDTRVSMDALTDLKMLDPENSRMLVSLDPNQDLLAGTPSVLDIDRATVDDLLGGKRIAGKYRGKAAPASEVAKRRDARRRWRAENGVPVPVDVTMRNFRKNGAEFVDHATATNALVRMAINLRVGTALLNPALYVSMGPEQWVRGTLDRAANLLTGQATKGASARIAAKTGLSTFSPEQLTKLNRLYRTLGQRADFKRMVYQDLHFLRPHEPGVGRVEKVLEGYAKLGSRVQDPTYGMRATTLARRYLEAAIQYLERVPTANVLTVDQLVAELSTDPQFLKKHHPEVHQAAANAIAQLRSLKQTVLSKALRGVYEPLSESDHSAVNAFGNLVLKMPLLFSGYAMNVLTTVTGMQGVDQALAAFLHGRKPMNSLVGRVQAKMRGDQDFDPETDAGFDMDSVMEGIDLSRAFIRGGLTHTGLFLLGMAAGSLNLSGEDDETRKRRRMSELQGAGFVYDPRRLENDFRNADGIFVDWLPLGLENLFPGNEDGQHMVQMNWTLKQFISPIVGMERFYDTGDFRQVTWGFQDALGAFPLINTLMWDDAVSTANELAKMAHAHQEGGTTSGASSATWLLANAVGTYERMLFENSFVNQIYVAKDRYDRDPYALPLRDSDGQLQRDIEGNPRKQDIAFEPYIDPETGQIVQGYLGRSEGDATLHALTENRLTLALGLNFFTGLTGDSGDYLREQMPIKTREFDKPEMTQDLAEAYVRAALQGEGYLPLVTHDEVAYIIKGQAMKAGDWDTYNNADQAAAEYLRRSAQHQANFEPLSVLDADGREALTKAGAAAVMRGLVKGSVHIGEPALAGVYIPFEMRNEIQKEWMRDLIQEGVDLGLDHSKAVSRMKRLWYGPSENPDVVGIGDVLWSKDISYSDTLTYNQLNTTYVQGPDGMPWATGFSRGGLLTALGISPVKSALVSEQSATGNDARLNTTDFINGINTGLRGLELVDESRNVPTDVEIGKAIEQAIKDAAQQQYTPYTPYKSDNGSSGYGYHHYSGGGYGGGGYSSYGPTIYFNKMYALPGGTTPYANGIPFINTSNPYIRRAEVQRQRVWSERGRLKQWQ